MAWRFVTHACGHQERINVDGPYVVVEQRVKNAERVSCPACIGIASRQRNRLDGFCELWGSNPVRPGGADTTPHPQPGRRARPPRAYRGS